SKESIFSMTNEKESTSEPAQSEEAISIAEFLESISPNQSRKVISSITVQAFDEKTRQPSRCRIALPEVQLHCSSDTCNRELFFRADYDDRYLEVRVKVWNYRYITYKCANCQKYTKTFAVALMLDAVRDGRPATAHWYKFGELPPYGPPTPSRLIS